ncbi:MAG TPA: DNA-binding protein WhiA [Bacillota bacterium]|nr:DNA-binding protein WhiA [Bacillota bacterium]HQC36232.1 DNA-binding protein WhiA [Bacillota bacterium]
MSFAGDTKKELTGVMPDRKCCELAEIAGFLRFAGSITFAAGGMGLKVSTDNPAVARLSLSLIKTYFGVKSELSVSENPNPSGGKLYELVLGPESNAEAILRETGMLGIREGGNYLTDGIDPAITKKRCCKKSALRGIFLAAGSVSDPVKSYHLEIACARENTAISVKRLIEAFGLKARTVVRRSRFVVYLKDAEQIGDFLSLTGATSQYLHFKNVQVTKQIKNDANRANNCDIANAERTVGAAQRQLAAIRMIDEAKGIESLTDRLYETARMRLAHPELSLSELAELFDPPLKKSGLNHRFEKIISIAENIDR